MLLLCKGFGTKHDQAAKGEKVIIASNLTAFNKTNKELNSL